MMRFLTLILIVLLAGGVFGQSRRVAPADARTAGPGTSIAADLTVKQMFDEANEYLRVKGAEFDSKKVFFSERLFTKTKLEQRQLAAKYATAASGRVNLAGEDFYYLGMLHWIAENLDGTAENLRKFVVASDAAPARRQTARSIIAVVLAKQKKLDEAETFLAEYLKAEPVKLTERARMEGEIAKAYQKQKDFGRMAPHAEEAYKAAKKLLQDASSRARGLDEILDAGMLVYEAFRDSAEQKKADDALEDMRVTAAQTYSTSFYYYAVDQKIRYMIDTGRKPKAMEYYLASLIGASKDFDQKVMQSEVIDRLKKREKHYKLLGEPAPELPAVDQWFPGQRKTLANLKGKVVLLDFWATWCAPCFDAFPSLIEWHQDFRGSGLEILGVTRYYGNINNVPADEPREIEYFKGFRLRENLPYDFIVAKDQSIQLLYGGTGLPTAVLIDRKGIVRYVESGTSAGRLQQIREMIVKLLAEK